MGTGPEDLQALAQEFLDACVEALDTIPMFAPGLGGAPERSFISPGLPAFDCCDQLTVHVAGVNSDPIQPPKNKNRVNIVSLVATATRCLPTGDNQNPPSADDLQDSAAQVNADGWALWNHIFNLIRADLLFTLCGEVLWDGLRSINPQGGCGGYTLNLRVELDGYEETFGS